MDINIWNVVLIFGTCLFIFGCGYFTGAMAMEKIKREESED